jgi:hypothetical protein
MALVIGVSRCDRCSSDQDCQDNCERLQWFYSSVVLLLSADQKSLVLLLMRGAEVRKVLENVGVRIQAAGRAFALGQEREAVIDHVVGEDAAIGILRKLRRIEIQYVGQCSLVTETSGQRSRNSSMIGRNISSPFTGGAEMVRTPRGDDRSPLANMSASFSSVSTRLQAAA